MDGFRYLSPIGLKRACPGTSCVWAAQSHVELKQFPAGLRPKGHPTTSGTADMVTLIEANVMLLEQGALCVLLLNTKN